MTAKYVLPSLSEDVLASVPLAQIEPDPEQPRRDLGDLNGLMDSLRLVGLVQPVVVERMTPDRYRLLTGERRFTAASRLGRSHIPAIVRSRTVHCRLEEQILENLHRKALNPFEEAEAYQRLLEEFGLTQQSLGKRLGRSQESVSETLTLLRLPPALRQDYRTSDRLSRSLLLTIARLPSETQMRALWERARRGKLTVRTARSFSSPASPSRSTERPSPLPSRSGMGFRYPIQTEEALVVVSFDRPRADLEAIVRALQEALDAERERLLVSSGHRE